MENRILKIEKLTASFGDCSVVSGLNLSVPKNNVTAVMGPSGCGKTTVIRCINRMHEFTPGAHLSGRILLNGTDIYTLPPEQVRRKIGMVFQRPNPFPTMSVYGNVMAGYTLNGIRVRKPERDFIVESVLRKAALWDEVKDSLYKKGTFLSGGQQQRLCIARSLALNPEVLLLDEPTSALDPVATQRIETLIEELKETVTILLVTHNIAQAARVSDFTAFMFLGELVEFGVTEKIFTTPVSRKTEEYLTGKIG